MKQGQGHLAAAGAAVLLVSATALAARMSEPAEASPAASTSGRTVTLRYDPQFILEVVAQRMGVVLRPEIPAPAIRLESRTPLRRLQAAAERQWGFRPPVFVNIYASAPNEVFLVDDAARYAQYGGTPDDSLAHELVHYLQATYLRDRFDTDWSESEAVAIQTWFRAAFLHRRDAVALAL